MAKVKAKLDKILDAVTFQFGEDDEAYLEKSTGKIWQFAGDVLAAAHEDDEEMIGSYYTEEVFEVAKKVVQSPDDFIELPTKYDMDEYRIMERFCYSIEDERVKETALDTIKGGRAFRRFKNLMHRYDLIDRWYEYRDDEMKRQITDWCEVSDIECV